MSKDKDAAYKQFSETFDEMLANAKAVKGEDFVKLVMQIVNQTSMMKLIGLVGSMSAESGASVLLDKKQPFGEMMAVMLKQNVASMAEALKVSSEMLSEALEFAEALSNKGEDLVSSMPEEDEEDE